MRLITVAPPTMFPERPLTPSQKKARIVKADYEEVTVNTAQCQHEKDPAHPPRPRTFHVPYPHAPIAK